MNVNNRQQILIIIAIAAIALWLGDRWVFEPLKKSHEDRAARIVKLKKTIGDGDMVLMREKSIRSDWDHRRTNTLASVASVAESQVIKAFERWSQDSRISITSIKPQMKNDKEDYMTLECHVDGFGNLPALTRFLYEVEKDPMAFKIETVEISARDKDGQQLTLGLLVSGLLLIPEGQ